MFKREDIHPDRDEIEKEGSKKESNVDRQERKWLV
jgi:hypothetical protein